MQHSLSDSSPPSRFRVRPGLLWPKCSNVTLAEKQLTLGIQSALFMGGIVSAVRS